MWGSAACTGGFLPESGDRRTAAEVHPLMLLICT
jgi:hypothetical protein